MAGLWQFGIDSWIFFKVELKGTTEEEQISTVTKEADNRICTRYEQDQRKVQDEDKSFFLLPVEVRAFHHSVCQIRQWIVTVDLAFNAWCCTCDGGTIDGACLYLAPLYKFHVRFYTRNLKR